MRRRRYVLQNTLSVVCSSNAFIFSQFRTLLRNGALATPFPSITSALFPVQRRGRGSPSSPNFQMRFVHPARCVGTFKSGFGIPHAASGRVTFKCASCIPHASSGRALSPLECALSIPRRMRIVPAPFPTGSEPRESKGSQLSRNSFSIRTYEKRARNSFRMRTYKKQGGGGPSPYLQPSIRQGCEPKDSVYCSRGGRGELLVL